MTKRFIYYQNKIKQIIARFHGRLGPLDLAFEYITDKDADIIKKVIGLNVREFLLQDPDFVEYYVKVMHNAKVNIDIMNRQIVLTFKSIEDRTLFILTKL